MRQKNPVEELRLISEAGIAAVIPSDRRTLRLERAGRRLPWQIDLGASAWVEVGAPGPGVPGVRHPLELCRLREVQDTQGRVTWSGVIGGTAVRLGLEFQADHLVFSVAPLPGGQTVLRAAAFPGDIAVSDGRREVCWSDAFQGALFRADGRPWQDAVNWDHAAMRVFGLSTDADTLAVIVDTALDAEARFEDDGKERLATQVTHRPALGCLGYARSLRLVPLAEPGHVAIANAFRAYAQQHGLWRSWASRVDENPTVAKLQGALVAGAGYFLDPGADQVRAMRALREYGFERVYLFSLPMLTYGDFLGTLGLPNRASAEALRTIQDLGYVCAAFLQVEEADESLGLEHFAVGADGQPIKRWQIGERRYYEIAKWRVPDLLPQFETLTAPCGAVHFDTLTAMSLLEHWGERPYDRRGDADRRRVVAEHYRRQGKIIAAESQRDWGTTFCDLNTSKRFTPIQAFDARVWTVPLTDLVYHDSHIRTNWEHHAYDDNRCVHDALQRQFHPFAMELMDLLTCSPPVLFPEGTLYEYEHVAGTGPNGEPTLSVNWANAWLYHKRLTDPETQTALPKALRVCQLHQRHGTARMTAHRFLDGGPWVQESEFASGLHAVVNFADLPYSLPDGRTVPARGALVDQ